MTVLLPFLFLLGQLAVALSTTPPSSFTADGRYHLEVASDIKLTLFGKSQDKKLNLTQYSSLYKLDGPFKRCVTGSNESDICLRWGQFSLNISAVSDECIAIESSHPTSDGEEISACIEYGEDTEWYGGPERWYQNWPVQTVDINDKPLLTGYDSSQSVSEPFWFSSKGASLYVAPEVPLFLDSNNRQKGQLCFIARVAEPYVARENNTLKFEACMYENAVQAQRAAVKNYLGKPKGRPADIMFSDPIYSTWVRYGRDIDQNRLTTLVQEIQNHSFPVGQIEIDDVWEPCYGASEFDKNRFPDIKAFTDNIHSLGGRVTAWMYPFINQGCNPAYQESLDAGRFIKDAKGNTTMQWWCGTGGAIDFTDPESADWWVQRTKALRDSTGLDSFKFDAGETNYLPSSPQLNADPSLIPNIYVKKYAEAVSAFQGLMEIRVGRSTQDLPVFVRMLDKDSRFGLDNGLQSVITTLFQMNLVGYPFVLPDMIGGNQYGDKITKELFIRWLQASTFMPVIQFSVVPWDFDSETVEIARTFMALHESTSELFITAANKAVEDGTPINTPIWWIAPDDPVALACSDEYLLAETVLVAPILEAGAIQRDIYLPAGTWYNLDIGNVEGPTWLRNHSAPLNKLPYFTRVESKS